MRAIDEGVHTTDRTAKPMMFQQVESSGDKVKQTSATVNGVHWSKTTFQSVSTSDSTQVKQSVAETEGVSNGTSHVDVWNDTMQGDSNDVDSSGQTQDATVPGGQQLVLPLQYAVTNIPMYHPYYYQDAGGTIYHRGAMPMNLAPPWRQVPPPMNPNAMPFQNATATRYYLR